MVGRRSACRGGTRASVPSCGGGCAARARPRSGAGGSCRSPRRSRGGGRRAEARAASPRRADAASRPRAVWPTRTCRRRAARVKGVPFGHAERRMSPRVRAAAAGAVAARRVGIAGAARPARLRLRLLGRALLGRGQPCARIRRARRERCAVRARSFDAVRERVDVDQRRLALALAIGRAHSLWPFIASSTASSYEPARVRAGDVPARALRLRARPPRLNAGSPTRRSIDLDRVAGA